MTEIRTSAPGGVPDPLIFGSVGRAAYGVLALLLPRLLYAGAGMRDVVEQDARYFNRLVGARDLLLAGATVLALREGKRRHAAQANVVCELLDSVALVEEVRARRGMDRMTAIGLAFNVAGHVSWLRALESS